MKPTSKKENTKTIKNYTLRRDALDASERVSSEFATKDENSYRNHLRWNKDQLEILLHRIVPKMIKKKKNNYDKCFANSRRNTDS